jgi:hypothetical protein
VALCACDVPQAQLELALSPGPAQECPSTDCLDIPMPCAAWISIRVIDPAAPTTPYFSQCEKLAKNSKSDLCAIGTVDLAPHELPLRDLEVQVAVYPDSAITFDADNAPICPTGVTYDAASGFPVPTTSTPALGGRSYYRPGDDHVTVTLGCTNLELIDNDTCIGMATTHVVATVDDFDTHVSVSTPEANRLALAVGEPRTIGVEYELTPGDVEPLALVPSVLPPAWSGESGLLAAHACLTVLDDTPQSTTTLTCRTASVLDDTIDFTSIPGVRLTKSALDQILAALATPFPADGLTIGVVLDANGNPRGGIAVQMPNPPDGIAPTIRYLSSDRTSAGGTVTSSGLGGGVFVSTDAKFGQMFTATVGSPPQTVTALGGRIAGKVTIVVLQFHDPIIGT